MRLSHKGRQKEKYYRLLCFFYEKINNTNTITKIERNGSEKKNISSSRCM
jgi:hypothetical protein